MLVVNYAGRKKQESIPVIISSSASAYSSLPSSVCRPVNHYLKKQNIVDPNNHDYRNFKFEDFSLAIDKISKRYSVVRIGQFQEPESKIQNKNFFDFTNNKYNEKDLVFFNYLSRYNVLSLTGLTGLQQCFRKKGLYVNFIPFNLNLLTYTSPGSIIIPKKIFSNRLNRNLNFL